jgi:hypothetical protein
MKITDILVEQQHPFKYAYLMQNPHDIRAAKQIFDWAVKQYGHSAPFPEIWIVSQEHMQHAAQRANHYTIINGQVYGWYSHQFPNKIFLSDRISVSKNKKHAAILVHEIGHYLQDMTEKHAKMKPYKPTDVEFLENDADELMALWLKT